MSIDLDPHGGLPVIKAGVAPEMATAALVLLHGRGASADNMLNLFDLLQIDQLAAVAPQAAQNTWYPQSFLAPIESNQPYLDSALKKVGEVLADLNSAGIPSRRIALLGFSQGACLASEFVARNPQKYGALMALSGGIIGPPGQVRQYSGSLDGTPVFLGASDPDPHVPFARVQETSEILEKMNATVDLRRYPGMPHSVNEDEMDACRTLLQELVESSLNQQ